MGFLITFVNQTTNVTLNTVINPPFLLPANVTGYPTSIPPSTTKTFTIGNGGGLITFTVPGYPDLWVRLIPSNVLTFQWQAANPTNIYCVIDGYTIYLKAGTPPGRLRRGLLMPGELAKRGPVQDIEQFSKRNPTPAMRRSEEQAAPNPASNPARLRFNRY
ncbi:hypothetical protein ABW20_dc0105449 [Dactylellina cionopaga]|nr:hypothetical protein ABW20_dc0105449 [Dactylellina cionopaga]